MGTLYCSKTRLISGPGRVEFCPVMPWNTSPLNATIELGLGCTYCGSTNRHQSTRTVRGPLLCFAISRPCH